MTNHGFVLANVSRRAFLGGVAAGALVLAVGLPGAAGAQEKKFGADGMPQGWRDDPQHLRRHRPRRHRHRDLPSAGDGPGRAHLDRDGGRRRARGRLVEGPRRAGAGRRSALRQPGYRRLALAAPLLHADAPRRRRRARHARAGGGPAMGRAGLGSEGGGPRRRARGDEAHARLRRARRRRRGASGAGARDAEAQGPGRRSATSEPTRSSGSSTTATSPPARRSTASTPAPRACCTRSSRARRSSAAR